MLVAARQREAMPLLVPEEQVAMLPEALEAQVMLLLHTLRRDILRTHPHNLELRQQVNISRAVLLFARFTNAFV